MSLLSDLQNAVNQAGSLKDAINSNFGSGSATPPDPNVAILPVSPASATRPDSPGVQGVQLPASMGKKALVIGGVGLSVLGLAFLISKIA